MTTEKMVAREPKDYPFFCHACLEDKLADENSPDPRYCQWCYDFLLKEAGMDSSWSKKDWVPRPAKGGEDITPNTPENNSKGTIIGGHNYTKGSVGAVVGDGIMSTVKAKKTGVDMIAPAAMTKGKRGPKYRSLPEDLIEQLAGEGMSNKAISAKLKGEFGIEVSYKTIQRLLAGQRVLV